MSAGNSRSRWWGPALVGLYAAWLAIGIVPISPIEGDEQGVINGATAMARGETAYLDLAYLPTIQPGSFALLAAAARGTGLSVETIFAVGTLVGVALGVWFASHLLAHLLNLPRWVAVAALLWCQEIFTAAYYLNTTALGMWLTFLALWLACRPPGWRTAAGIAVCLALAGWIRIDCLLPAPAIPVLFFVTTGNWRTTVRFTALIAVGSLILVSALYHASGVTWGTLASTYSGRGAIDGWWPTLRAMPLILSPLVCVLSGVGVVLLVVRREWRLLAVAVAGALATLPIYGTSLASTKYFYHLVPFLLVPALYAGALSLKKFLAIRGPWRTVGTLALALLLATDQALALQTSSAEFRRYLPEPTLAVLATVPGPTRPIRLVLGAGEVIPTTDGFRLRGGALYSPLVWHREKTAMRDQLAGFADVLRRTPDATVYYSGWLPYQMVVRVLRGEGYVFTGPKLPATSMPYAGKWTRDQHRVRIDYLAYRTSAYFDPSRRPANATGADTYFVGDLSGEQSITELADAGAWQPLWREHRWRAITFYRRHGPASPP